MEGQIKFFDPIKNFGFIKAEDGEDFYFHINDCVDTDLNKGDKVTFDVEDSRFRPGRVCAVNVTTL